MQTNHRGSNDVFACTLERLEVMRNLHSEGGVIMLKGKAEKHQPLYHTGCFAPLRVALWLHPIQLVSGAGSFTAC